METMHSLSLFYGLYYVGYLTYKSANGQTTTIYTEIGCNEPIQE